LVSKDEFVTRRSAISPRWPYPVNQISAALADRESRVGGSRPSHTVPASAKKLIYILNYVHPEDTQHFVHVFKLLDVLEKNCGWTVRLLSEKGGTGETKVFGRTVHYMSHTGRVQRLLKLARELISLRQQGFRIVFVRISLPAMITAILVGRLIGLKTVFWHSSANHDLDRSGPLLQRIIASAKMRFVALGAHHFVTGPATMVRYYREKYRVPERKLRLLYNDIDLRRFAAVKRGRGNDGPVRVLFVHSFSPSKNALKYMPAIIDRLNRASRNGLAVEFRLAGDGPERDGVAALTRKAEVGVNVEMLGALPNTALPAYYAEADIFIMPSYREGMPRALMEAMSSGLPAIATDAGGTRDLVGPLQSHFIVPRDDHETFADRLYDLLFDEDARRKIGMENRRYVARFSTESVAEMYDRVLSEVLA